MSEIPVVRCLDIAADGLPILTVEDTEADRTGALICIFGRTAGGQINFTSLSPTARVIVSRREIQLTAQGHQAECIA